MNLLVIQAEDGTSTRRYSKQDVKRGDLVLFSRPNAFGVTVGVVAKVLPSGAISKNAVFGYVEAIITPEIPHTYEVTEFGTICIYNAKVPTELQATFWRNEIDVVRYARNANEAREQLRKEYTEEFFARAEGEL